MLQIFTRLKSRHLLHGRSRFGVGWGRHQIMSKYGCFRKWWVFPPKSSILIGFSIDKPSVLRYPYFWKHPYTPTTNRVCTVMAPKIWGGMFQVNYMKPWTKQTQKWLGCGLKYLVNFSPWSWRKWSKLTSIFFKWFGNHQLIGIWIKGVMKL